VPSFAFATLPATTFTWLFITLLELQPPEQAVVLDFLLENLHGSLKVIVDDLDLQTTKLSQISRPFLFIAEFPGRPENPDIRVSYFVKKISYNNSFPKTTEN
jgi:hypothetical protein